MAVYSLVKRLQVHGIFGDVAPEGAVEVIAIFGLAEMVALQYVGAQLRYAVFCLSKVACLRASSIPITFEREVVPIVG